MSEACRKRLTEIAYKDNKEILLKLLIEQLADLNDWLKDQTTPLGIKVCNCGD